MADKKIKNPLLRFPEFVGKAEYDWQERKLDEIFTFLKGKGISKNDVKENANTPCIRYGEIYTVYGEIISEVYSKTNVPSKNLVFSQKGDIIIPSSGETAEDIAKVCCVLNNGIALGGDINILRSNYSSGFFAYYLSSKKKKEIAKLAQGNSVVHIYRTHLKLLKIFLPEEKEQQKIATFLSAVDKRIELLSAKYDKLSEYKKGIIQKIFSQTIRFKDKNKQNYPDWQEKIIEKLGKTFTGLNRKTKEDFGKGKLYIQYMQVFEKINIDISKCGLVDISQNETQNKVQYGDIIFTTSSETPKEVGMSSVFLEKKEVYLNSFCFAYRLNDFKDLLPEFSQFLFRSNNIRKRMFRLAQGSTRFNISKTNFMKENILIPKDIKEQQKIAEFLSSIDKKIEALQNQIKQSKKYKKSLMQQMFV